MLGDRRRICARITCRTQAQRHEIAALAMHLAGTENCSAHKQRQTMLEKGANNTQSKQKSAHTNCTQNQAQGKKATEIDKVRTRSTSTGKHSWRDSTAAANPCTKHDGNLLRTNVQKQTVQKKNPTHTHTNCSVRVCKKLRSEKNCATGHLTPWAAACSAFAAFSGFAPCIPNCFVVICCNLYSVVTHGDPL